VKDAIAEAEKNPDITFPDSDEEMEEPEPEEVKKEKKSNLFFPKL
jgi:hypothetical protein